RLRCLSVFMGCKSRLARCPYTDTEEKRCGCSFICCGVDAGRAIDDAGYVPSQWLSAALHPANVGANDSFRVCFVCQNDGMFVFPWTASAQSIASRGAVGRRDSASGCGFGRLIHLEGGST